MADYKMVGFVILVAVLSQVLGEPIPSQNKQEDAPLKREKRKVPPIEVACTLYTISKSCTSLLRDCPGDLCDNIEIICNGLSVVSALVSIACNDTNVLKSVMEFFKDPDVVKGITDIELFWDEFEKNPLEIVEMIMTKLIKSGALQLTATQFLYGDGFSKAIAETAVTVYDIVKNGLDDFGNDVDKGFKENIIDKAQDVLGGLKTVFDNSASERSSTKLLYTCVICMWSISYIIYF